MASATDNRERNELHYRHSIRTDAVASVSELLDPESPLFEEQWLLIKDLFASCKPSKSRGRPLEDPRKCVEGVLWIVRPGARWRDFPKTFPSPTTCWRRLRQWTANGVWQAVHARLLVANVNSRADE